MISRNNTRRTNLSNRWVWILAVLLLISFGIVYRVLASRLELFVETPIKLPISLSAFPTQVGGWVGKDVPIPVAIQRVAQNDDFLNRLCVNKSTSEWANLYIAYSARPRTMLGHKPEVCYVAGGWIHDITQPAEVVSVSGRRVSCLIHRFHMPAPHYEERVVLNYYILNGQLRSEESGFSGLGLRSPNIGGDPARYVAQVQISSALENSVLDAAKDTVDLILDFFPDPEGKVRALEHAELPIDDLRRP